MIKKNRNMPDKWLNYTESGTQVPHTQFLPFKVPLKEDICKRYGQTFTPSNLRKTQPNLKLIIDLTNTDNGRYYYGEDFKNHGIHVEKIKCIGGPGVIPSKLQVKKFQDIVDLFLNSNSLNSGYLIGVHCTHGLNRTGYFICKYMIDKLGIDPQNALKYFEEARGHSMERAQLIQDILNRPRSPTYSQTPLVNCYESESRHKRPRNETYSHLPRLNGYQYESRYNQPRNQSYSQSPLTSCYEDEVPCKRSRNERYAQSPLSSCYDDETPYNCRRYNRR